MKIITSIILVMFTTSAIFAQQLTPEVIGSGGKHTETENYKLTYTVGELAVTTLSGDKTLTQGFHQGSLIVSAINEFETLEYEITAFPNPTTSILYINLENVPANSDVSFRIFDLSGREVNAGVYMNRFTGGQKATLDLRNLVNGTYIINMFSDNQKVADVKVVKIY